MFLAEVVVGWSDMDGERSDFRNIIIQKPMRNELERQASNVFEREMFAGCKCYITFSKL